MADHTGIEWTDAAWQPITGCSVVSPGCTNCYAMRLAGTRLADHPSRSGLTAENKAGLVWTGEVRLNEAWVNQPLRWRRPRRIFVCAHGDLFHENVPDEWIDRVFAVMALAPRHTFQVLTKRSARMREYFETRRDGDPWAEAADEIADIVGLDGHPAVPEPRDLPLPNVWLGVSTEDQRRADERIPDLLATPAAVRFISAEPLLGPLEIDRWLCIYWQCSYCKGYFGRKYQAICPDCGGEGGWSGSHTFNGRHAQENRVVPPQWGIGIDWVIVGGESGIGARPMHPDWARSLRDQCQAAGVKFFEFPDD